MGRNDEGKEGTTIGRKERGEGVKTKRMRQRENEESSLGEEMRSEKGGTNMLESMTLIIRESPES